jgi:hypothetical protein
MNPGGRLPAINIMYLLITLAVQYRMVLAEESFPESEFSQE